MIIIMSFVDIDECTANTDNCDDDDRAVCTNTNGGFICTCKQGFTGDGISCTGIIVKYRQSLYNKWKFGEKYSELITCGV